MAGDYVYVVGNPLEQTIQRIDYFHGKDKIWGPVAQMSNEDEDDIYAFEMFAIHPDRGGKVIQSIIYMQRAWRQWKKKTALNQSNQDKVVVKREAEISDRSMPPKKRRLGRPTSSVNNYVTRGIENGG